MNKKKLYSILYSRYIDYVKIIKAEHVVFGFSPRWISLKHYYKNVGIAWDTLLHDNKTIKYGKGGEHERAFISELLFYMVKMIRNGAYHSYNFIDSLYPPRDMQDKAWNKKTFGFEIIDTPSKNAKALRREVSFRNDSLMGFVILRLRLEEMILNYYFLFKAKNFIKEKKWSELYLLLFKINYSNFQDEISIKLKEGDRKFRQLLKFLLKDGKKLHVVEIMKYVAKQKDLRIGKIEPNEKERIEKSFRTQEIYKDLSADDKIFNKNLHRQYINEAKKKFNLKQIPKIYDELSDRLHPNNLFLRNILTADNKDIKLAIIVGDHIKLMRQVSEFLSYHYVALYNETEEIFKHFIDIYVGEKPGKEILTGFRQSVENKIMKNYKTELKNSPYKNSRFSDLSHSKKIY